MTANAIATFTLAAAATLGAMPDLPGSRDASRLDRVMGRYASGDAAAFGELYEAIAPRLHRFCLRLSRQRDEADDLFQEALLRLHRARASYVPGAKTLPWAFAIARSAYLDRIRNRRRRPEDLLEGQHAQDPLDRVKSRDGSPESDACARALFFVVDRELARMSEKNRSAYVLLREEGLSVSEVAAVLGTTSDVVKQRAHRAYEQIRAAMREAGWDGGKA